MEENSSSKETTGKKEWKEQPHTCKGEGLLKPQGLALFWIDFRDLLSSILDFTASLCKECKNRKVGVSAGSATVGV